MRRQDIWIDFGLSGLTKWFAAPWVGEVTPEELLSEAANWGDGAYAPTLLQDASRLLGSQLPTPVIDRLWCAAIGLPYDPAAVPVDGRAWLDEIVRICAARIRRDEPSFTPAPPEPITGGPSRDAVLEEIREAEPSMLNAVEAAGHPGGSEAVAALRRVVVEVDPDLGFRLFLRVLKAYRVPITESRYLRYHELGEDFGYHELVVDDGTLQSVPCTD
ncbi:hypothetical protein ACIP2X_32075 [Streptomyces sp. NPDC089424]|uniref:hypothetical protein n=1 Tax=Streptomyces sp. NPDC089424 TaxID=3365917 RepID=UPI003806AA8B